MAGDKLASADGNYRAAGLPQPIPIQIIVGVLEHRLATIAALGDVMRYAGDDDAGHAPMAAGLEEK